MIASGWPRKTASSSTSSSSSFTTGPKRLWPGMSRCVRTATTPGTAARRGEVELADAAVRDGARDDAHQQLARERRHVVEEDRLARDVRRGGVVGDVLSDGRHGPAAPLPARAPAAASARGRSRAGGSGGCGGPAVRRCRSGGAVVARDRLVPELQQDVRGERPPVLLRPADVGDRRDLPAPRRAPACSNRSQRRRWPRRTASALLIRMTIGPTPP